MMSDPLDWKKVDVDEWYAVERAYAEWEIEYLRKSIARIERQMRNHPPRRDSKARRLLEKLEQKRTRLNEIIVEKLRE